MNKQTKIKANPVVSQIIKVILKLLFKIKFNAVPHMTKEVKDLKPPFVVLLNHQGFWDPFIASVFIKQSVFFVASDAIFRSRFLGFVVKLLGAIPKTKAQSDIDALKNIFAIKEKGNAIGIFPEGQRTWTGTTLPIIKSTSKLIRMLKIPVVTVVFKGGYYTQPRWGKSIRKGQLVIDYKLLFSGDEVATMRTTDIQYSIEEALSHDEIAYHEKKHIIFKGKHLAENIEQYLFMCPSCGKREGFSSSKNIFKCNSCGKTWVFSNTMEISSVKGDVFFTNVRDWGRWQFLQIQNVVEESFNSSTTIFNDKNIMVETGYRSHETSFFSKSSICLNSNEIQIYKIKSKQKIIILSIPIEKIVGVNVQNKEILDFYYNNKLYTMKDPHSHFNAYKYWLVIDYIQRTKLNLNIPQ